MKKMIIAVLAVSLLSVLTWAQDGILRDNHPDEYTVRKGDTLWDISQKYRVGIDSIKRENKISSNDLKVGMVLKIIFG